jgi:hypothetical protein
VSTSRSIPRVVSTETASGIDASARSVRHSLSLVSIDPIARHPCPVRQGHGPSRAAQSVKGNWITRTIGKHEPGDERFVAVILARRFARLLAVLALMLASRQTLAAGPPIAARPFLPLTEPGAQVDGWKRQLCARPDVACAKPADLRLYRLAMGLAGDPPGTVWGILGTSPVLLKLLHGNGQDWSVLRRWDFSGYRHSHPIDDPSNSPVVVYPALYPAGPGGWAVALVSDLDESYSGGGATFSIADFVVLPDSADAGAPAALYTGVTFSCSKLIRACFTEEDYKRRGNNCHDEYDGFLTLEYAASTSPGRYAWTAVWHERSDGSRHVVPLPLTGGDVSCSFAKIGVCDGGWASSDGDPCSR